MDLRHTLIVTEGCQSGVNLAALGKSVGIADIFSGGDLWVLLGGFAKNGCLIVVF